MADFYENKQVTEEVILVGVALGETSVTDESLDELEELAKTAGAVTVGRLIQNREMIHPGTYLGKGKLEELAFLISETHATGIICDDELSPAQMANMEDVLDIKVMDRTLLILDIFAQRATTREGKIQVELAQLRYRATRLVGMRNSLSRLGGGIGTRGPGEKKLEVDRRLIRERISQLKRELEDVKRHREVARQQRQRNQIPVAAIVGYTNAGKSTLLNRLTGAGVLEEDKLFATLDPTSRALKLPNGVTVMLIDTVGLVRRLPHHLVDAFRSTLEEAAEADIILNVCDVSSEEASLHLKVTRELLESLGCKDTPIIPVLNKCDLVSGGVTVPQIGTGVRISAKEGKGIDELLHAIEDNLPVKVKRVKALLPFDKLGISAEIREKCILNSEEYVAEGLLIDAVISEEMYSKIRDYIVE